MSITASQILLLVITSAGTLVLFWGIWKRRQAVRSISRCGDELKTVFPGMSFSDGNWQHSQSEVEGSTSELIETAAERFAKNGLGPSLPVKVTNKSSQLLCIESLATACGGKCFSRCLLRFTELGQDRTRVDYALDVSPLRRFLTVAEYLQYAGLFALIIGYGLMDIFVARADDPSVRWQAFQMFQVGHLLWPPFLCLALFYNSRKAALSTVDGFVCNLPHGKREVTK